MARTAPIPNIPAIPGMNPGVFIMGGGGSGGGKGGKGGSGAGGKSGANGKNGGDDAAGDAKGAGSCGRGTGSSCGSCNPKTAAGDPVDIATGRVFTLPHLDLELPGPLPLQLFRSYSSHARHRDVGLGAGWTSSYAWEIELGRSSADVWDDNGTMLRFELPPMGGRVEMRGRVLGRDPEGLWLEMDGIRFVFHAAIDRDRRYRLSAVVDRNGNRISLAYEDATPVEIMDSVGRLVRVRRTRDGQRIEALEAKNARQHARWIELARYEYSDVGDLVAYTDAEGHVTTFSYDDDHRLTSYTRPDRLTFHFRYDAEGRCIETWGARGGGSVPGLAEEVPRTLADGTPARGVMHCRLLYDDDYREVADSKEVRRFFADDEGRILRAVSRGGVTTRRLDEDGFMIEHVDALGAMTRFERDAHGNTIAMIDPLGHVTRWTYGPLELPEEVSDDIGVILRAAYDARGNLVRLTQSRGEVTSFEHDVHGNVVRMVEPNGGVYVHEHDAESNLVRVVEPNGDTWRYSYDALGNCVEQVDPLGHVTRMAWDRRRLPVARYAPNGTVTRFRHDGDGNLVEMVNGDGEVVEIEYLLGRATRVRLGGGQPLRYAYDREGFLAEVWNERGEVRRITRNPEGLATEVRSFDGRTQRFSYDAMNRLVRYENGRGEVTAYERDARGQILKVAYPDGKTACFEYDARGRMTRAANSACDIIYTLDDADQLIRETLLASGTRHTVEHAYDALRDRSVLRTSLRHEHRIERDVKGRPIRSVLGDAHEVRFAFDGLERELWRALPGGAIQETAYHLDGPPVRRAVLPAFMGPPPTRPGEPDWVGPVPRRASVDKAWSYSPGFGRIRHRRDTSLGELEYEYDAFDQITAVRSGLQTVEAFRYDVTGNVEEATGGRRYGPGNVLRRKGNTEYVWDADGCLIEKAEVLSDGTERVFRYDWDGAGRLARVTTPDDRIVEMTYDPFARRVAKSVFRRSPTGELSRISSSRYVWDKDRIVHEIREEADERGNPVVRERTYFYDEQYGDPLAEREDLVTPADRLEGPWLFHVNDPIGTPEHLVLGDGQVALVMKRSLWGKVEAATGGRAATPLRFDGQYDDPEIGLCYNRYRYYDADIGRYISEDPAGDLPDANVYRYCRNPVNWVDPLGLVHKATAKFTPKGGQPFDLNGGQPYQSKYKCESDGHSESYNKANGLHPMGNFAKKDKHGVLMHRTSDTEAQILRDMKRLKKGGMDLKGGHLEINGQLPPCSACNRKMMSFAKKHGCTIDYKDSAGVSYKYP